MKKIGIIAEYNPFHLGHEYQIKYAKNILGAEDVVVIMSGNFTQRGLPAICDKHLRANAAVASGADIVIEMPPIVAVADTPMFAQGAVDILLEYGCNGILFGSEDDNLDIMKKIASIVATDKYWKYLEEIKENEHLSPDEARIRLLQEWTDDEQTDFTFVNKPNNLLGIYYISALYRRKQDIDIYTNKRLGQEYFESDITNVQGFASASAIRKLLKRQSINKKIFNWDELSKYMPNSMLEQLKVADRDNIMVFHEEFFDLYLDSIKKISRTDWNQICSNLPYEEIKKKVSRGSTFETVCDFALEYLPALKLYRIINWILLGIQQKSLNEFLDSDHIGWVVLAARTNCIDKDRKHASLLLTEEWNRIDKIYMQIMKKDE